MTAPLRLKVLSLTQPWASLVASGAKRVETRSFKLAYRGPLAIHATREKPCWSDDDLVRATINCALRDAGLETSHGPEAGGDPLPRSALIATCNLVDIVRVPDLLADLPPKTAAWILAHCNVHERDFGNWSPGRYLWLLEDVVALVPPIPAKGARGLWTWTAPPLAEGAIPGVHDAGQKVMFE